MSNNSYSLKEISQIFNARYHSHTAFFHHKEKHSITYGTLYNDVIILSKQFNFKNKNILLFHESGYPFVIGFYAIFVSGNIPILVNHQLKDEISHLESLCEIILTNANHYKQIKSLLPNKQYILIDQITNDILYSGNVKSLSINKNDTFLHLFTSGSTGQPKLISKTYYNIITELQYLYKLLSIQESDVFLPLVPGFHIYGLLFTMLLPLLVGCKINLDVPFSPLGILEDGVIRDKSTVIIGNPSLYSGISFLKKNFQIENLSHVKYFISSTMPLERDTAENITNNLGVSILELYGSTETGGIAYRKTNISEYWTFFPYVKNKSTDDILEISSPTISEEYLKKSWYKTGDIIKYYDNNFILMGRDIQIAKIAGNRVSILEVENMIKKFPQVKDAVVIVKSTKSIAGEILIAFIVLNNLQTDQSINDLKQFCRTHLADFKLPKHFIAIKEIPRTMNQKIQYHKLLEYRID